MPANVDANKIFERSRNHYGYEQLPLEHYRPSCKAILVIPRGTGNQQNGCYTPYKDSRSPARPTIAGMTNRYQLIYRNQKKLSTGAKLDRRHKIAVNLYVRLQASCVRAHQAERGMRLFLTGNPGVGKTTLIRAVVERLEGITSAGFYTEEIRQSGQKNRLSNCYSGRPHGNPGVLRETTAHSRKIFDPR